MTTRDIYAPVRPLARPVVRGQLNIGHAHAHLLVTTLQEMRAGLLGRLAPRDVYAHKKWILADEIELLERARDVAFSRIRRRLRPMIAVRAGVNFLLAEAHNENGAAGFPLGEDEVTQAVREQVWHALPPAQGRRA